MEDLIGRVTRCSTRGFVGAMRVPEPEVPAFGGFCLAEAQQGQSQVVGLIYDVSVGDDEFARQIASSETATAEQIADHQENRQDDVEDFENRRMSSPPARSAKNSSASAAGPSLFRLPGDFGKCQAVEWT